MARSRKTLSKGGAASTPISSMIDIVFLLIIFFVVTAAVDKEIEDERVTLMEAPHGKPVAKKDPRSVIINIRKDGTFSVGMHEVTMNQIRIILTNAVADNGLDTPIVIRADKDAQHYYVKQVMEAVNSTKLYHVMFNAVIEGE